LEHGLVAHWLFLSIFLLFAWWGVWTKVISRRSLSVRWIDVWVLTGVAVHLNFIVCLGALAFVPRRPPWFDPRPIPSAR